MLYIRFYLILFSVATAAVMRSYDGPIENTNYKDLLGDDLESDDMDDQSPVVDSLPYFSNNDDETKDGDSLLESKKYEDINPVYSDETFGIFSNLNKEDDDLSSLEQGVQEENRNSDRNILKEQQNKYEEGENTRHRYEVYNYDVGQNEENIRKRRKNEDKEQEDNGDGAVLDTIIKINKKADQNLPEGDIKPSPPKKSKDSRLQRRNAIRDRNFLWETRNIPYEFDKSITAEVKTVIMTAIEEFHKQTCIRFHPFDTKLGASAKRLSIFKGVGCWSYIGKTDESGPQQVSIGRECDKKGIIMHELMHAVGFYHEQSRADRDKYVEILWENIIKDAQGNFGKQSAEAITGLDLPYDYDGLMHYGEKAFSKNGKVTIRPLNRKSQKLGQNLGFSPTDLMQIKKLYGCNDNEPGWSAWSNYSPCNNECFKRRQRICFQKDYTSCKGSTASRILQDLVKCNQEECKRDGHWGRWSPWGPCSASCGNGGHRRSRVCNDPTPRYGGKKCPGISQEGGLCYAGPCNLGPNDCTFEKGTCIWRNGTTGINWTRRQFGTFTQNTGPNGDHSLRGEGHYMYLEATGIQPNSQAVLVTKELDSTAKSCLLVWYNMYGANMGSLRVTLTQGSNVKTLKELRGDQGEGWKYFAVQYSATGKYTISLIATRGISALSDIAVDDIFIRSGSCQDIPVPTESVTTVTTKNKASTQPTTKSGNGGAGVQTTASNIRATNNPNGNQGGQSGNGGNSGNLNVPSIRLITAILLTLYTSKTLLY